MPDRHQVPVALVDAFAVDFVALAAAAVEHTGEDTTMGYRVELVSGDGKPYAALDVERHGALVLNTLDQPPWSRTVRRFRPVVGELAGVADLDARRDQARLIASDVRSQFGLGAGGDL